MELGGKVNAITSTAMISTKTLEVKPQTKPNQDRESDLSLAPFPIKKENKKPRTRGDQEVKYKECQKNHAASKGGHVVDGCCEFMAGGEYGIKCAACNCHRSFHRKEVYGQRSSSTKQDHELMMITPAFYDSSYKAMQPRGMHHPTDEINGQRTSSSSEDMKKILSHRNQNNVAVVDGKGLMMMMRKKKRVRTKINVEQKEKMKEFAERLGWRMQKKDEEEIDKFCRMVNLRRQVFQVWIHNNKQAMKRNCNTTSDLLK